MFIPRTPPPQFFNIMELALLIHVLSDSSDIVTTWVGVILGWINDAHYLYTFLMKEEQKDYKSHRTWVSTLRQSSLYDKKTAPMDS